MSTPRSRSVSGFDPSLSAATASVRQGLESTEAANLVAYLNGLRVGDASWTLSEINRVLFLRHLYRSGRLAEASQVPQASAA